ncbi:MAG: adenylyl-sulfate kinase [Gammaproteobacteria bacterium]|jgi:adenylyl-sulfate kinase|nr:adenylyl-sulfate kinase [Gammaproteobacteria bacterium]
MVVWLIGLSGSGKTTLANEIVKNINKKNRNTILIDGDMIREIFNNDLGYSMDDRLLNAQRICQLGKLLDKQGVNVVCAILSIFPETRAWNRENIENYYEVYIDTPIEVLIERDSKGLYSKFKRGEISDVAGMDIKFPIPNKADLVIKNISSKKAFLKFSKPIIDKILES